MVNFLPQTIEEWLSMNDQEGKSTQYQKSFNKREFCIVVSLNIKENIKSDAVNLKA